MTKLKDWITRIESNMPALRAALDAPSRKIFEDEYYALTDELSAGAEAAAIQKKLDDLLARFPAVIQIAGLEKKPPKEGIPPGEAAPQPGVPPAVQPPVPTPLPVEPATGGFFVSNTTSSSKSTRQGLSAEEFTTIFKEVVSALIALALVWTTVRTFMALLDLAGDATRLSQAKDLLTVLTGLLGVVMGYYFGRLPADARASQAQAQAAKALVEGEQAQAHSERISEQAEVLADQASRLAATMQAGPTARGGGAPAPSDDLQRWAEGVEALRRSARRR